MVSVNLGVTSLLSLANRYAEMAVLFEMIAKKKKSKRHVVEMSNTLRQKRLRF